MSSKKYIHFVQQRIIKEMHKTKSVTSRPNNKVMAATFASAVGSIGGIIVTASTLPALENIGIVIPQQDKQAFKVAVASVFTAGATFTLGYLTPPGLEDGIKVDSEDE